MKLIENIAVNLEIYGIVFRVTLNLIIDNEFEI